MTTLALKNSFQIKQHQAVHAHMRFLISAVGKLDLQTCLPRIVESNSLRNRILLYCRSLSGLREAIQRDTELDKLVFSGNPSLRRILAENQEILAQINKLIKLAETASKNNILREELNVILVKINLAVNTICETVKLHMIKEDVLAKKH